MAKGTSTVDLPKLFSQLQLAGEDGDYEWGLEVVKEILKIDKEDFDALSCKVVCLIQISEFEEALDLIDQLSKRSGKQLFLYERAYVLYKQEKYVDSLKVLDELSLSEKDSVRILDLRAQVNYRMKNYEESVRGFQAGSRLKDGSERRANLAAALSYCDRGTAQSILSSTPVKDETMEQCFNLATVYLSALGDYDEAESLLRKAEKLCQESENLEEDEIQQDLIPIRIQLGYTLQETGRNEEALAVYNGVLKLKPTSATSALTAANNIIVLNGEKDIFDSKKKIKLLQNEEVVRKLTRQQQLLVLFNRCMFLLRLNQLDQCHQLLSQLKDSFPNTDLAIIAEVSLLYREKKTQESLSILEEYLRERPNATLQVYLLLAQLYWNQNNIGKACEALESIPGVAGYLGVVSVLASQLRSVGDSGGAARILSGAFDWWKSRPGNAQVLWEISRFELRCGRPCEAAKVLEHLLKQDPPNTRYLATLVSAYSRFDPHRAEEISRSLPALSPSSSLDVDSLEHMPSFQHSRRARVENAVAADQPTKEKKKRKKRKKRLPKNYDPSKAPDPERWLPLRERSYYRKSKKKGQSSVGRGTQGTSGSSAAVASKLDASRPKTLEEPVEGGAPSKGKPQQSSKRAPQQQRKKKKGKH